MNPPAPTTPAASRPDAPPLRIVFAGTPSAAVPSLERLARGPHEVVAVVTREDAALGRKRVLTPSPVAARAEKLGLPVIRANRLDDAVTDRVLALGPDLGAIVAYGGLVREPLLSGPRLGWINLHFSLLPRWRGAAPVQRAIMAGDAVTGAAVFQLVPALDAGDVFGSLSTPIGATDTSGQLLDRLADDGAGLLASVVDGLADGTARAVPQSGETTLAPKLSIDDARVRPDEPVDAVDARIRAVTPEPGAFVTVGGTRLGIVAARPAPDAEPLAPGRVTLEGDRVLLGTATAPLELVEVHPAGKRPMAAAAWWRGRRDGGEVIAE